MPFIKKHFRFIIQLAFFLYSIGIGARFYFYINAISNGDMNAVKPAGVEAFLPISALIGLKQLLVSGIYDHVHPAGLTIFIAAIVISMLFKKSFCGYICPFGFVSEQVSRMGFGLKIHRFAHYPLTAIKYLLLGFFVYTIFNMSANSTAAFIDSPYNKIADAKMLGFIMPPSATTIIVFAVLVCLTLLFKNVWCRYLCPYGAFLGIVSFVSPFKVKRTATACIQCKRCAQACPSDIPVNERKTVVSPECMGCMSCVKVRIVPECLNNGFFADRTYIYGIAAVALYLIVYFGAALLGYTESSVTNAEYLRYFKMMDMIGH